MVGFITLLAWLALLAALVSWFIAVVEGLRAFDKTKGKIDGTPVSRVGIYLWPFAARRMTGDAAAHAASVNKAMVAFMVSVLVLTACAALSSNLSRFASLPAR
jgi:hypothetical protein